MTLGPFGDDDEYADKPYGNPRRAANIRWESRSRGAMRRVGESIIVAGKYAAAPFLWLARFLWDLGDTFGDAAGDIRSSTRDTGRRFKRGDD